MLDEFEILQAHILIVDDLESNVALLTQMLLDKGYTNVSSTRDAMEVAVLHRRHQYDLILLDLHMPDMDGFAVMEALKTNLDDDFLPVIVITAQPGHKLRALQAGARDFVSKPFELPELRTRIRNALEVRLLYKRLEQTNQDLEARVLRRTAELRDSEARYRSLTELATDWHWEQDDMGMLVKVTGPARDMLGFPMASAADTALEDEEPAGGWDPVQLAALKARIASREPFLDFLLCRTYGEGLHQRFHVSGEPVFNRWSKFVGYRGVGVEINGRPQA